MASNDLPPSDPHPAADAPTPAPDSPSEEAASPSGTASAGTSSEGEGSEASDASPPNDASAETSPVGHDAPLPESVAAVIDAPVASPNAVHPATPDASSEVRNAAWANGATAVALSLLFGFAAVSFFRFQFGKEWLTDFVGQNKMDGDVRTLFLIQILGGGVAAALVTLVFVVRRRRDPAGIERLAHGAWFLSPLLLLPALPVLIETTVWQNNHRELLPIVLFGAMLAEFFVFQSLRYAPFGVGQFLREATAPIARFPYAAFFKRHGYLAVIVTAAIAYGLFMSFYTIRWHHRLGTAIFDLGINNNLFAGGLHGRFNHSPIIFPEEPAKYVANHVKVGLYIFLPFYALVPKPETLLVIQSISLGLGAIPLFAFARRRIPEWAACLVALAYLSYYPMHGANFYEMKEPPTAAAFVLATIWAVDSGRFKTGWVFFFLSMFMREDMPIPLTVIGVFFLLSGQKPRTGLAMTAIAASWFVFLRFKVMTDAGSWWFPNMYKGLWAEPDRGFRGVLKTLVSNPQFVLQNIFVEKKFWYLMHLFTPLVFLPARRWYLWAAFVPGAILTLLVTDYDPPLMFSFQYVMHWSPYLFVAAVLAMAAIAKEERFGKERAAAAVVALALASATLSFNYGAFTRREKTLDSGYHKINFTWDEQAEKTYRNVVQMVEDIPKDASVAATERVGAHLSGRILFYTLRRGTHGADYVVARKYELRLDKTRESVRDALRSGEYGVLRRYGEFALLKKGADTKDNEALAAEWGLDEKKPRKKASRAPAQNPGDQDPDTDADEPSGGGD